VIVADLATYLNARSIGELYVEDGHVGTRCRDAAECVGATRRLSDDLDLTAYLEQLADSLTNYLVIVHEKDANRGRGLRHGV